MATNKSPLRSLKSAKIILTFLAALAAIAGTVLCVPWTVRTTYAHFLFDRAAARYSAEDLTQFLSTYTAALTTSRYLGSLFSTVVLSAAVTLAASSS